ncbi:MAG: hypothetical protein QOH19_2544 [Actinomycetota bacterium]|jgi:hypothetical protein|nr:hypothetical protein [Actinomycetota bacterium]
MARTALDSAVDAWQFEWLEEGLLPRVTLFVGGLSRCGEHLVQEFGLMSGMDAVSRRRGVPCSCDCRVTAAGPAGTADRIGVRGLVSGVEFSQLHAAGMVRVFAACTKGLRLGDG